MLNNKLPEKYSAGWITLTALFLAINIVMSSFGIPVPGGHLYLCDIVICTAAIILDPLAAFVVGGIGSFLGDFFFYPAPMFVSLAAHGLQAVIISAFVHCLPYDPGKRNKSANSRERKQEDYHTHGKTAPAAAGICLGAVVMIVIYSLGRAYIYSTPALAVMKLPYEIMQAAIGGIGSILICRRFHVL